MAWYDIHHLAGKRGGHGATNLIALCRRHHTAAHRRGWKLTLRPDATLTAARRGVAYTSLPRNQQRLHPRPRGPDP